MQENGLLSTFVIVNLNDNNISRGVTTTDEVDSDDCGTWYPTLRLFTSTTPVTTHSFKVFCFTRGAKKRRVHFFYLDKKCGKKGGGGLERLRLILGNKHLRQHTSVNDINPCCVFNIKILSYKSWSTSVWYVFKICWFIDNVCGILEKNIHIISLNLVITVVGLRIFICAR